MRFKANQDSNQTYNNADSFAMVFDEAWKNYVSKNTSSKKTPTEKIEVILKEIHNHPFLQEYPEKAREVAEFRLRLLNLK